MLSLCCGVCGNYAGGWRVSLTLLRTVVGPIRLFLPVMTKVRSDYYQMAYKVLAAEWYELFSKHLVWSIHGVIISISSWCRLDLFHIVFHINGDAPSGPRAFDGFVFLIACGLVVHHQLFCWWISLISDAEAVCLFSLGFLVFGDRRPRSLC